MALYRDEGVVLRAQKLGEADRIITLLTRSHGRVRAVAKGVRRTGSRFGSRLEPFMQVDLQMAEGRNLDVVTQVETIGVHGDRLSRDYARWTAGMAMLETAERLTEQEKEPALQQYRLLVGAIGALVAGERGQRVVLDAYLLRSLAVAGFAPSLDRCGQCGARGPHRWFSVAAGGSQCEDCRVQGASAPGPGVVALLGALLSGDWAAVAAAGPAQTRAASGLVAAYTQWHLERGLRSLPHVQRV